MKKTLLIVLGLSLLALSVIKIYFMVLPEVVVTNLSGINANVVTIQLPNSRIVFDDIPQGESRTIYYSLDQADGTYKYSVLLESGDTIVGECGYLTHSEIGKVMRFTINDLKEVKCSN